MCIRDSKTCAHLHRLCAKHKCRGESSAKFKLYEAVDGKITHAKVVDTNGSGHGALAGFLMQHGVDTLVCGGIGGGAQAALAEAGIKLYGGVSGDADAAVSALLNGSLGYDPNVHCDHHDPEHGEAGHTCGCLLYTS